jgi:hypothetical protein
MAIGKDSCGALLLCLWPGFLSVFLCFYQA